MTVVAFLGFGEAGGILAEGLLAAGAEVRAAYDILIDDAGKSAALKAKADAAGIEASASAGAAVAVVIFACLLVFSFLFFRFISQEEGL